MSAVAEKPTGTILTRIYIREDGDLIITDFWEEIRQLLEGPEEKQEGENNDAHRTGL